MQMIVRGERCYLLVRAIAIIKRAYTVLCMLMYFPSAFHVRGVCVCALDIWSHFALFGAFG